MKESRKGDLTTAYIVGLIVFVRVDSMRWSVGVWRSALVSDTRTRGGRATEKVFSRGRFSESTQSGPFRPVDLLSYACHSFFSSTKKRAYICCKPLAGRNVKGRGVGGGHHLHLVEVSAEDVLSVAAELIPPVGSTYYLYLV